VAVGYRHSDLLSKAAISVHSHHTRDHELAYVRASADHLMAHDERCLATRVVVEQGIELRPADSGS
jgi:hypothetical protein